MTKPGWLVFASKTWTGTSPTIPPEARISKELVPLPMLLEAARETVCGVCQLVGAKTNRPVALVGKMMNRFESPSRAPEKVIVTGLWGAGLPTSETVKGVEP